MSIFDRFLDKKTPNDDNQVIQEIDVDQIIPNSYQPRQEFDEIKINELAQSIQANGLLQPIVVRKNEEQKYEIIAGERRFRAIQLLNWTKVTAIVRNYSNQESAALALIENLQRQDLNPIEEAKAYVKLEHMKHLPQKDLARELGKSQSYVANKIRLLKLDPEVQTAIAAGQITQRHGRALIGLSNLQQQQVLHEIITHKLTVLNTEKLIQKHKQAANATTKTVRALTTKNPKLSINTIRKSVRLAQKNGAQFTYDEIDSKKEYQMIITVKKEDQHG